MTPPEDLSLLERLLSPDGDPRAAATALLADHNDPRIRLLAELWARQEGDAETVVEESNEDSLKELDRLRERNAELAAALGACEACWGVDPGCERCRGHGGPGGRAPDRQLFAEYVLPAIRRLKRTG